MQRSVVRKTTDDNGCFRVFSSINRPFGPVETRYRGLAKNTAQRPILCDSLVSVSINPCKQNRALCGIFCQPTVTCFDRAERPINRRKHPETAVVICRFVFCWSFFKWWIPLYQCASAQRRYPWRLAFGAMTEHCCESLRTNVFYNMRPEQMPKSCIKTCSFC
jgi:hypothetical protein